MEPKEIIKHYGVKAEKEKIEMFGKYIDVVGIECPHCNEIFISTEPERIYDDALLHKYGCNLVELPKDEGLCQSCVEPCIARDEILDELRMSEGLNEHEVDEPEIENGKVTWCPFYQEE